MNTTEFETNFYKTEILKLENKNRLNKNDLAQCQQMLQIIDNNKICYPKQYEALLKMEVDKRLEKLLNQYNVKKLGAFNEPVCKTPQFKNEEILFDDLLNYIKSNLKTAKISKNKPIFLQDLANYTNWVLKRNNSKTSFVFLLRDMFLPFLQADLCFENVNAQPLLFGRKMLKFFYDNTILDEFDFDFSDDEKVYTNFLEIIFDSATKYNDNFDKFFDYLKPKFLKIIKENKVFYLFLKNWLENIKTEKIIVVESGRYATIPLILKCIDDRVDFTLFSTSPEFYKIFKDKIFVMNLDKMIDIEQSISQNQMFVFSSVNNDNIYVKINKNKNILNNCLDEIKTALSLCKKND